MTLSQNYRIRFYVEQDVVLSIEDGLGAVKRHLERAGIKGYAFTMATANDRAWRVCVTIKTRDQRAVSMPRHIKQDYPSLSVEPVEGLHGHGPGYD